MSTGDVFLGMLRSEYDKPTELPETFISLQNIVEKIVQDWKAGKTDGDSACKLLQVAALTSSNGNKWAVGASSGRWYRKTPTGNWTPTATPPLTATDPSWDASLTKIAEAVNQHRKP